MDKHTSFLIRIPVADIAFLVAGHVDVVPTRFELGLYKAEGSDTHYNCAVKDCPIAGSMAGTAESMVNIGRFVLCRDHGIKVKRAAERMYSGQEFRFFRLVVTLANAAESDSDGLVRQARQWLAEEPARLQAHKDARQSSRLPGPSVDLVDARIAPPAPRPVLPPALAAAAVALPASSVAASALPVPTILPPVVPVVPASAVSGEVAKLQRQLAKLASEALDPDSVMTPDEIKTKREAITLRLAELTGEVAKLQRQLAKLNAEASDPDSLLTPGEIEAKREAITKRLGELGVTEQTVQAVVPVAAPASAPVPAAPVVAPPAAPPAPAPIDGLGNRRFGLEVRPGAQPLPRHDLHKKADPGPMQVVCLASGGTRKGNPFDLAATVGYFGPADYERVQDCFAKLGDLKRQIFDHVYVHAAKDADDMKLRDFRSAEFKATCTETFRCKLCDKKLEALYHLRKAVIEFGKSVWPDQWQGRRDDEVNGTGTLRCPEHPSKGLFGLLFDRVTGQPRPLVGENNVCGACHKAHVNETEGPKRDAVRHARQEERAKASRDAKGAAGGGGNKQKKGGKKK